MRNKKNIPQVDTCSMLNQHEVVFHGQNMQCYLDLVYSLLHKHLYNKGL